MNIYHNKIIKLILQRNIINQYILGFPNHSWWYLWVFNSFQSVEPSQDLNSESQFASEYFDMFTDILKKKKNKREAKNLRKIMMKYSILCWKSWLH